MRMTPETILRKVCRTIDILIDAGAKYEGLFPSLLDLETHDMLVEIPPAIDGQRDGDRSHLGSNLIHDEAAILTMYALGRVLEQSAYTQAADQYLRRFATHCTNTETGLYPWGEHAFWHLTEDRVGNSYVDVADPNRWSEAVGRCYLKSAFPEGVAVPAMDAGLGLGLFADLFVMTRETRWLDGGIQLAERLIDIYFDHELPRGAVGIDWYESQMGPSFLLHGLARIALLAQMGEACSLDADYTAR
ncbi:MAG: hypothetical protein O7E52_04915 [Candidatus Poribacteria bacterium]|nr:hypothetical protein [Candidatus Poribacteria bacterium]